MNKDQIEYCLKDIDKTYKLDEYLDLAKISIIFLDQDSNLYPDKKRIRFYFNKDSESLEVYTGKTKSGEFIYDSETPNHLISFNAISGFIQSSIVTDVGQIEYGHEIVKVSVEPEEPIEPEEPEEPIEPEEPEEPEFVVDNCLYYTSVDGNEIKPRDVIADSSMGDIISTDFDKATGIGKYEFEDWMNGLVLIDASRFVTLTLPRDFYAITANNEFSNLTELTFQDLNMLVSQMSFDGFIFGQGPDITVRVHATKAETLDAFSMAPIESSMDEPDWRIKKVICDDGELAIVGNELLNQ